MDFGLSEDQQMFRDALRGFLAAHIPIDRVRTVMESDHGRDDDLREGLGAQGVCGILIDEEYGGSALGLLDAAVAAEELGAAATPMSMHSACVMAPLALQAAGSEEQRQRWLPAVAAGKAGLSFVCAAPPVGSGRLDGSVRYVADAGLADAFVVAAGTGASAELLLVARDSAGLEVQELSTVDGTRRVGELVFNGLRVDDGMRMAHSDAAALIDRIVDAGRIALAADALGLSQRSLDLAVAYSLEREQFGRTIGSFQAVKHMCAETAAEIEPVRSLLWYAAFGWDQGYADTSATAALLKSHAAEVATRATSTSVQVYGGIGFTDECDMHIWFKRAGYDRQMLGSPAEMRARAADLTLA